MQERQQQTEESGADAAQGLASEPTADAAAGTYQSAELLESMGLATGDPGQTDAAAGQAGDVASSGPNPTGPESAGGESGGATPAAPAASGGNTYTVVAGDYLYKIAIDQLGSGLLWRAIYQANRETIGRDPNKIEPGMVLTLPTLDDIITTNTTRSIVQAAFSIRWGVDVAREPGARNVEIDTFRRVHAQLLQLPKSHVEGTWRRLLYLNDSTGGYMSHDGEFGLGEDVAGAGNETFGTGGLFLDDDISAGATVFKLPATSLIGAGVAVTVGEGDDAEQVEIESVNGERTEFTVAPAFAKNHSAGDTVAATNNPLRGTPWLEAVVRHEIAHAIDGGVVDTSGFTTSLGDWHATSDFDTWAGRMGNPWATNDGSEISDTDKAQIKSAIDGLRTAPINASLKDSVAADHAINTYWDKDVPVIEAAKPMARNGGDYWQYSEEYYGTNNRFFTINDYYQEYHSFNSQVQFNQVRSYQTYSPAEFFAEIYSVYYEEAGTAEDVQLGKLVPVSAWKSWMDNNVASTGQSPADVQAAGGGGPSRGKSAGVSH